MNRDQKGVSVGEHEDKLGQRASDTNTAVILEDVRVPADQVLAAPGFGFKLAMETFNQTRPDIGAMACGVMKRCLDECVAYAKERKTFDADRAAPTCASDDRGDGNPSRSDGASRTQSRVALDNGIRNPIVSSYAKAVRRGPAMQCAIDAVQVFGGNGYVKDYPVEKLMRDAKSSKSTKARAKSSAL